jgi:hypothetical protein
MVQPARNLLPLWDHGWCDCNELELGPSQSWQEVVSSYLRDESFGTSFVGPEFEHTEFLHGPFWRSKVNAGDFVLLNPVEFYEDLQTIRQPSNFQEPVSDAQWTAVEDRLERLRSESEWVIKLRLTEIDSDRFHDWGRVLDIFREYLFANPNLSGVTRLTFGYD